MRTHSLIRYFTVCVTGYKTFFMLSSNENEIFMLINVKMPTAVGISTYRGKQEI